MIPKDVSPLNLAETSRQTECCPMLPLGLRRQRQSELTVACSIYAQHWYQPVAFNCLHWQTVRTLQTYFRGLYSQNAVLNCILNLLTSSKDFCLHTTSTCVCFRPWEMQKCLELSTCFGVHCEWRLLCTFTTNVTIHLHVACSTCTAAQNRYELLV